MTRTLSRLVLAAVALTLAATAAPAETLRPKFDPDRFTRGQAVDNKYFPLRPGTTSVLRGRGFEDGERIREKSVLRVLDRPGPRILGVRTTIHLDRAFENGRLVEKTFDYFAQDNRGNVWYLGEDVTNYRYDDQGNLIGTDSESAWRAGRRGARPGWIMPARQVIGQRYFQERARRDEALDKGQTHAVLGRLRVGDKVYRHVLRVLETNPFEPGAREFKFYAPKVGLIRVEEGLNRNLKKPDIVFERTKTRRERAAAASKGSKRSDDGARRSAKGGKRGGDKGGRRR
ncbi:MAG TPA: hypothetical protein VM891_01195 [Amaricoccus sp.]|nr:hypothetical protein [Amaricoccus sp.]